MPPNTFSLTPPADRVSRVARRIGADLRASLTFTGLGPDARSGLSVALAALPITLGVALASDVAPGPALVAAIVGGLVATTLGSLPVVITAPAAALAVLTGSIVDRHGLPGILVATVVAGLVQLALGVTAFARLARLVPQSVLRGFDVGLGALLLIGQLPRLLGLEAPDESHVFDVVTHVGTYVRDVSPTAVGIGIFSLVTVLYLPRAVPAVPAAFVAVVVPTAIVIATGVGAEALPMLEPGALGLTWQLPDTASDLPALVGDGLLVAAVCSVQSLRTLTLVHADRTEIDLDRELVSQGVANVVVGLVGGIPVSAVPKRSKLALEAGGTTRRAGWLASLFLLVLTVALVPLAPRIPIAALAGVVLALALRLLGVRELVRIARVDRAEGAVLVLTAVSMVLFDFEGGIQAGVIAALALGLVRGSRGRILLEPGSEGAPHHLELGGPLTFVHVASLDRLEPQLAKLPAEHGLVIDVRHVEQLDHTAASHLLSLVQRERARGMRVAMLGPLADVQRALVAIDEEAKALFAMREQDLDRILPRSRPKYAHQRMVRGVERFRSEVRAQLSPLLAELADGQEPHTLIVACADSRVAPALITGAQPGEIFVVRNIGALVPPSSAETRNDEGAAIEYAVKVLGVRNLVVCGHSQCGAMKALKGGEVPADMVALANWSRTAREIVPDLSAFEGLDEATRATTRAQVENVMSYPVVAEKAAKGELTVTAWFYDVERAEVLEWRPDQGRYVDLGARGDEQEESDVRRAK
ncbi:MAG: bifunctional SulP family inorganic anion transporter/carbonic anhydrase [Deltaproteobacteria bacterium]|nr:bifunctional SulP family inorganic anion transporter/carbonic anhydrase [Deltaproteobacteria bacterium]